MADSDSAKSVAVQAWAWLEEQPLALAGADEEQTQLVVRILDWIRDHGGRRPGMKVAAIYGPRGSGKTSVMLEVLRRLSDEKEGYYLLPLAESPGPPEASRAAPVPSFDPTASRDHKELPFDFLRFLDRYEVSKRAGGARPNLQVHLKEAGLQQARITDPERFLDLEKELVSALTRLPERLGEARCALARADEEVAKEIEKWFKALTGSPPGPQPKPLLILPIDDADLAPAFAFEVLELVRRHLRYVDGVVLLCADPDQLRSSVAKGLRMREQPDADTLAQPWLDKLVDVPFHLPVWTVERWWSWLRSVHQHEAIEVPALEHVLGPIRTDAPTADYEGPLLVFKDLLELLERGRPEVRAALLRDGGSDADPVLAARDWLLEGLLPRTPRLAKTFLRRVFVDLKPAEPSKWVAPRQIAQQRGWRVEHAQALTILALLLAVDTAFPALGLWQMLHLGVARVDRLLKSASRSFPEDLTHLAELERQGEDSVDADDSQSRQGTGLSALPHEVALQSLPVGEREAVRAALNRLGWVWRAHVVIRRYVQGRVMVVSLDADAEDLARSRFRGETQVEHIDLRGGRRVRPPVHEFKALLESVSEQLAQAEATYREPTTLTSWLGKVPASIAVFLGWRLRFAAIREVLNDFNGQLTAYPLPSPRLEPRESSNGLGFFTRIDRPLAGVPFVLPEDRREQVLVLDLNRRVSLADLDTLPSGMRGLPARILRAKEMPRGYEVQDFLPVLRDMFDHIAWMNREEGARIFHLIFVGPISFAFALGRQLHSQGIFHLYEWERATQSYQYALSFPEEVAPPDLAPAEPAPEPTPSADP